MVGVAMLGGLAYYISFYFTAERRVGAVCSQFSPGIDVAEAMRVAKTNGMNSPQLVNSVAHVVETVTFGRYGCKLQFSDGRLTNATYDFRD